MMSRERLLGTVAELKALAERLSKCPALEKLDQGDHQEPWALAHAFSDLEESFRKIVDDQLKKLTASALDAAETRDLLLEIGEEFRHIVYHINDPKFYRYLKD